MLVVRPRTVSRCGSRGTTIESADLDVELVDFPARAAAARRACGMAEGQRQLRVELAVRGAEPPWAIGVCGSSAPWNTTSWKFA